MKKLLIVESPTKAKTINKFLGDTYAVISSFGHIRDLPKKEMGVDFENGFEPKYIVPTDKKKRATDLKRAAKDADEVYLATDEDREGEAIAWHIAQILKLDPKKAKRITFHEITKKAINKALEAPRTIEQDLVDAQQARRILDRIVGYELSPFLWKKVRRGLSAGRVQSVAVRLIVERERERRAFDQEEYWTIEGLFEKSEQELPAKLTHRAGKKLDKLDIKSEEEATKIVDDIKDENFTVSSIEKKHRSRKSPTPLRTSILQQEANNKFGYSAKQTMRLAQKLYETGRITYMRTDSMNLSKQFLDDAQSFISSVYGADYAKGSVQYKTKSKGAQEAHEAIRPTDITATPDRLKSDIDAQMFKIYDLIWRRTVASQLPPAKIEQTAVDFTAKDYTMRANGSIIVFDGFMKVYKSAKEKILPDLKEGEKLKAKNIEAGQHFTQPPARYSDAMLIKELEEHGIGRPSTYAPTIGTIVDRGYIDRDENRKLFPLDIAFIVNDLLVEHFENIVNFEFTATMEKTLDEIAEGKVEWRPMLEGFYGPFHENLEKKEKDLTREDIMPPRKLGDDPKTGKPIYVKTGRFGGYIQLGEYVEGGEKTKNVSLLKSMNMESVTYEEALKLLELPRLVGSREDGTEIQALIGPYGPYLKSGKVNASIPEDNNIFEIDEATARVLLKEAEEAKKKAMTPIAELGEDPNSKSPILIKDGRFGPYITDGKTNVSIPKSMDPKEVTAEIAIERLQAKRENPRARWPKKKD